MKDQRNLTRTLTAVAMGRRPADLVIRNVRTINVNTAEILEAGDIAIAGGRIALVGNASHTIGAGTAVVDGEGRYASPGFLDGHLHIESAMLTVEEYARTVIPHGTTAIFPDPHEIANVLGAQGLDYMLSAAKNTPLRVFTLMPSCVPAVPGFEVTGAELGPEDTAAYLERDDVFGLGELMNVPGVVSGDEAVHRKLDAAIAAGKPVTGHYASPRLDAQLSAYVAAGVCCCHESVRREEALAKMRLGMYVQIREGSAWRDLKEVIHCITDRRIDTRFATLVSDDAHCETLVCHGHMDHILRRAVQEGVNPVAAIQMATINTAQCYGLAGELGAISPGKRADIVLLSSLEQLQVEQVFIEGREVAAGGLFTASGTKEDAPASVKDTVHLPRSLSAEDFAVATPRGTDEAVARVIRVEPGHIGTKAECVRIPAGNGGLKADVARDIAKIAVIERHRGTGEKALGFVSGFGLSSGAMASTVAHDAHNLMVVGVDDDDMAFAANTLAQCGGGMVAVEGGRVLGLLALPIAGLMSEEPAAVVAKAAAELEKACGSLGCGLESPFLSLAFLSLAVLPELRITNKGLVDTVNYRFVDLVE